MVVHRFIAQTRLTTAESCPRIISSRSMVMDAEKLPAEEHGARDSDSKLSGPIA